MPEDPKEQMVLSVQDRADVAFEDEAPLTIFFARVADEIPEWPSRDRDIALDKFWRTEPILAGAIYSMTAKVAALDFRLTGRQKAVSRFKNVLLSADLGSGWVNFAQKVVQDLLTQDNGAFIELLRPKGMGPEAPVAGIAHLDSQRCVRTGNAENPVKYTSMVKGVKVHRLPWYSVIAMSDMPSAREQHRNQGFCAVSRVLRAAQYMRDVGLYKRQKISGKHPPGLLFVKGARRGAVKAAITTAKEEQRAEGDTIYTGPIIIASNDPGMELDAKLIELAGLPDGYDEDTVLKWYIAQLALDFGTDYSEFSPLPGGNLGSANQVENMSARSRGKGPGVLLQQLEFAINWFILPPTVEFQFASTDPAAERERVELRMARSRDLALKVQQSILQPAEARVLLAQEGDIPEAFLDTSVNPPEEDNVEVMVKQLQDLKKAYDEVSRIVLVRGLDAH